MIRLSLELKHRLSRAVCPSAGVGVGKSLTFMSGQPTCLPNMSKFMDFSDIL